MEPINITLLLSIGSALATAIWTVWTWSEQHDEMMIHEREKLKHEQDLIAAEYLNPYLLTAEMLHTRLDEILYGEALKLSKSSNAVRYEIASPAAFETLYIFAAYFFWQYCILRYGPYVKDNKAVTLLVKLSRILSSSQYPGEAFRFSVAEQIALGMLNVHNIHLQSQEAVLLQPTDAFLSSLYNLPLYTFINKISQELGKASPLSQSQAVHRMLTALDQAQNVEELEGRERLIDFQRQLTSIIEYLETQEDIALVRASRPEANISGSPNQILNVVHKIDGRIRLRISKLYDNQIYAEQLQQSISSLTYVWSVNVNLSAACITINYDANVSTAKLEYDVMVALKVIGMALS